MQLDHAIVIGGSIGGLLAARVLSDHFSRVTLIERDSFPETGENRRGVPQGRHTHGLLSSGAQVLERYFPGLLLELERCGAVACDLALDGFWFQQGAPLARFQSGLRGLLASRPLLEGKIRERVLALPNLECRQNVHVSGLAADSARQVSGVRIGNQILAADLVVDASGRGSHAADWLADLGYTAPPQEKVEISLGYATRWFRRRPERGVAGGNVIAVVPPTPDGKRGGVVLAQEGDRWTVTLVSHFQSSPPLDLPGFIEFARTLPSQVIYELVKDAEPVSDGIPARMQSSLRRRYERLRCFPKGFLVFGDAICSFNPIYGQGMSVSALEAVALDAELCRAGARAKAPLAQRFFAEAGKLVDIPWSIAVGNDLRMPETVGHRTAGGRFINWYVAKLHRAAQTDTSCALAFHRVANLLEPPPSLMRPATAWRVLKANLFNGRTSNTYTPALPAEPHSASNR